MIIFIFISATTVGCHLLNLHLLQHSSATRQSCQFNNLFRISIKMFFFFRMWSALGNTKYNNKSWTSHFINEEEEEKFFKIDDFCFETFDNVEYFYAHDKSIVCWEFPHSKAPTVVAFSCRKKRKILSYGGDGKTAVSSVSQNNLENQFVGDCRAVLKDIQVTPHER